MDVLRKSQKTYKKNPKNPSLRQPAGRVSNVYEFGDFRVNEKERTLLRNGKEVRLTPKVFELLLLLIQKSGSLVEKDTLLNELWPDTFVEEANLSVNVAALRKALGEAAGKHRYIETVPKRGYRFVAGVAESNIEGRHKSQESTSFVSWEGTPGSKHWNDPKSLAVIPFHNTSNDPNAEYHCDGITETIINKLSRLNGVRVVARNTVFRYRDTDRDHAEIAKELGVRSVVSGRILQLGDRVIIRTELVDAVNGWQLWGGQYHRKLADVLAIQDEISEEVCKRLEFHLTKKQREQLTKHYTENIEAYQLYLKGRYHWNKYSHAGLKKAIDYFSQAIETDPTYALAYAGLADCYYRLSNVYAPTREAMPKAKAAVMRALEIDPDLSEAHAALGLVRLFYDLDWPAARESFQRAIEVNPNYSIAHQRLGLYFNLLGQFDEARNELELARDLDPLSPQLYCSFALMFFLARQYDRVLSEVEKTLEMDNNYVPTLYLLARTREELGQFNEAITVFEKILTINDAPTFRAGLAHVHAAAGNYQAARTMLEELEEQSSQRYVSAYSKAVVLLALGEKNQAFSYLEQAYDDRCEMMTWLKVDPAVDEVRSDLRFTHLLRRIGLHQDYLARAVAS
jgi:TolB-like protein/Tfp pilus assembly protein PilF